MPRQPYRGPLKAVILDWAGTTVDFGSYSPVVSFVEVFKRHGVAITIEQARRPMGLAKKDHIRTIAQIPAVAAQWWSVHGAGWNEAAVETLYQDFIPLQLSNLLAYADPIPGTTEAVDEFRARGLKIGSTTGYNRQMMELLVPEAARRGYAPDAWVCPSDVPAGRPYPWMCYRNAIELEVFPLAACVKVGDTLPDVEEGLNAGMWTIGVALTGNELGLNEEQIQTLDPQTLAVTLERIEQRMLEAGAHYVVNGIVDVPSVLDQITARLADGDQP